MLTIKTNFNCNLKIAFHSLILCGVIILSTSCSNQNKPKVYSSTAEDTIKTNRPVSARPVHWSYEGESGPSTWGTLSPTYAPCKDGNNQSPIDIIKTDVKGLTNWSHHYSSTSLRVTHTEHMEDILDNGHTIQVNVDTGNILLYDGKTYTLKQFHFHTPSEHTINGNHQPMEMHLVHQSEDGNLAVIGILMMEGKTPHPILTKIIANLPATKGETKHVAEERIELNLHLPTDNNAYHYTGSLTTPPCTENVQWIVLYEMISVSKDQIDTFVSRLGSNNRPVQSLNNRVVTADDLKVQSY